MALGALIRKLVGAGGERVRRTVGHNRVKVDQKSKLANVIFKYFFRSLEKENILKNMIISKFYFLRIGFWMILCMKLLRYVKFFF